MKSLKQDKIRVDLSDLQDHELTPEELKERRKQRRKFEKQRQKRLAESPWENFKHEWPIFWSDIGSAFRRMIGRGDD